MTKSDEKGKETAVILSQLRRSLTQHFSKSELRHLAFDLGVEYEELPGSTRSDKALALIGYLQRYGRFSDLIKQCRQLRPNIDWPDIIETELTSIGGNRVQPTTLARDSFSSNETGLEKLQTDLGQAHPRYGELLVYQQRLLENITQTRRYGDTETRRADRAEIIDRLNELSFSVAGISFNKLCQ